MKKLFDRFVELAEYKRDKFPLWPVRGIVERTLLSFRKNQETQIKLVELQFSTTCNLKCNFCPYSKIEKPKKFMSNEVLDCIIKQLKDINFKGIIMGYATEESLLHPDFVQMIGRVSENLPDTEIQVSTNGKLLTEEIYDKLLTYPNIFLCINTHGHKDVIKKAESFKKNKNARIYRNPEPLGLMNWAGIFPSKFKLPLNQFCMRPFTEFPITVDGDVRGCGLDFNNVQIMGNIMKQSIAEIWNGYLYRRLRCDLYNNKRKGICSRCDSSGISTHTNTYYTRDK